MIHFIWFVLRSLSLGLYHSITLINLGESLAIAGFTLSSMLDPPPESAPARRFVNCHPLGASEMARAKLDEPFLKTSIMSEEKVQPHLGDLIMPEDMQQVFQNGGPPNFVGKSMVLMGPMGTGKTTLFNKLTGLNCATSAGADTCTTKNRIHYGLAPASELLIVDTPGIASSDVQYEHALEVRKALTTGTVSQIVAVQSLPNNSRTSELSTLLQPIDKIMGCDTFRTDSAGTDTLAKGQDRSPLRTRAFLVLTFRDRFNLDRKEWMKSIETIRKQFSWVGPVALIDKGVSVAWLYNTIVACAGYTPLCCTNHYIPLVEFFVKFPLSFNILTEEERSSLQPHKDQLCMGMAAAQKEVEQIKRERLQGFSGSPGYVEKLGASLDCLIRFLDDLYDCTTLDALAEMCKCEVDDLWASTDEAVNHGRVERWNAIKMEFAPEYQNMKKQIQRAFPDEAGAGVYKRCPYCKEVYVKPLGCDFGTTCGKSRGGADTIPFTYTYNRKTFEFKVLTKTKAQHPGWTNQDLEHVASKCRKAYRKRAATFAFASDDWDESKSAQAQGPKAGVMIVMKRGCGRPLKWETMPCLTREELVKHGLVPDYIPLEPCNMAKDDYSFVDQCDTESKSPSLASWSLIPSSQVDTVLSWLERLELGQYKEAFKENSVDKDLLLSLTEDDLRTDFGVQSKYHVRKILLQSDQL